MIHERVALVTGGTKGIGLAIVRRLLSDGFKVVAASRTGILADQDCLSKFNQRDSYRVLAVDVRSVVSVESLISDVVSAFGSIDVVINNAGVLTASAIDDISGDEWDVVLDTNLKGTFLVAQAALPHLRRSGCARIINISSNAGRMGGVSNSVAYSASKGGVIALTYALARRLAAEKITVNCIAPGPVETEMFTTYAPDSAARVIGTIPTGRLTLPEEVAAAVAYFAGSESGNTTGAILDINGGMFTG